MTRIQRIVSLLVCFGGGISVSAGTAYCESGDSMLTTSSRGHQIAYTVAGNPSGPRVLLVHGFPNDHTTWNDVADLYVKDGYYVVTMDLLGNGSSTKSLDPRDYKIFNDAGKGTMVDDVVAVVNATELKKGFHYIGHDWGGLLGWAAARDQRLVPILRSGVFESAPYPGIISKILNEEMKAHRYKDLSKGAAKLWYHYLLSLPPVSVAANMLSASRWSLFRNLMKGDRDVEKWIAPLHGKKNLQAAILIFKANSIDMTRGKVPTDRIAIGGEFGEVMGIYNPGDDAYVNREPWRRCGELVASPYRPVLLEDAPTHWGHRDAPVNFFNASNKIIRDVNRHYRD